MAKRTREMSVSEWLATQSWLPAALARLAEPRGRLTIASIRRSTTETNFQDSVARIVAKYPTGDDPTSARYQAHSFIQVQEIGALLRKRWDAEALAQHRHLTERRSEGGRDGGGKSNKEIAALWQKAATPTYLELREKSPRKSANELAGLITGMPEIAGKLPDKTTVARWVSKMDKRLGAGRWAAMGPRSEAS